MSLNKANMNWRASQIAKMVEKEKIRFDLDIQRAGVWEQDRKSELIHSAGEGWIVPPVYAERTPEGVYFVLDGQQRLTALSEFLNDKYSLIGVDDLCVCEAPLENSMLSEDEIKDFENYETYEKDGMVFYDWNGKKFSELPLYVRNTINTFSINIWYFENLTHEEEVKLFKKLNNGKGLTSKERNIANCRNIEDLIKFKTTPFVQGMFTAVGIRKKHYIPVILKVWMMCFEDIKNISFDSKNFNKTIENALLSQEEIVKIDTLLDFVVDVHNSVKTKSDKRTAKKLFTETHLVSVAPFIMDAMEREIDYHEVADWFISFFQNENETSNSEGYNEASKAGSARAESVRKRNTMLEESYNAFFQSISKDEAEDSDEFNVEDFINTPDELDEDELIPEE